MGDEDPRSKAVRQTRNFVKRKLGPLRTHLDDLLRHHIDHMDQGDLDVLDEIVRRLEGEEPDRDLLEAIKAIHDVEQCEADMEREGLLEPEPEPEPASPWASVTGRLKRAFLPPRE